MSGSNSSDPVAAAPERAEPLALTVHGIDVPDLSDRAAAERRRTFRGRLRMLLVLAICASPVVASYLTYYVIRPQTVRSYGALIQPTRSLPALTLTTLDGAAVPAASLRGQWLLIAVGSSACDKACENRLFMQRQLREMLGRERERLDKVWLITDAGPLSPALRGALQAQPAVTLLRADRDAVAAWLSPEPGRQLDEHLYLVDPMGEWMLRVPAEPDPGRVKRDLERVLRASSSWDLPGR